MGCPNPLQQRAVVVPALCPPQAGRWCRFWLHLGEIPGEELRITLGSPWDHSLGSQQSFRQFLGSSCPKIWVLTLRQRRENPVQGLNISLPSLSWEPSPPQTIPGFYPPLLRVILVCFSSMTFHTLAFSILLVPPHPGCCPGLLLPKLERYFSAAMTSWLKCWLSYCSPDLPDIPFCNPLFQLSSGARKGGLKLECLVHIHSRTFCPHPMAKKQPKKFQLNVSVF